MITFTITKLIVICFFNQFIYHYQHFNILIILYNTALVMQNITEILIIISISNAIPTFSIAGAAGHAHATTLDNAIRYVRIRAEPSSNVRLTISTASTFATATMGVCTATLSVIPAEPTSNI